MVDRLLQGQTAERNHLSQCLDGSLSEVPAENMQKSHHYRDPSEIFDSQIEATAQREELQDFACKNSQGVFRRDGQWYAVDGGDATQYPYVVIDINRSSGPCEEGGAEPVLHGHRTLAQAVARAGNMLDGISGKIVDRWNLPDSEGFVVVTKGDHSVLVLNRDEKVISDKIAELHLEQHFDATPYKD